MIVYVHNNVIHSSRKKELLPLVTAWLYLDDIMLKEISQIRKTNIITSLLLPIIGLR
jgi:hypothetical protein